MLEGAGLFLRERYYTELLKCAKEGVSLVLDFNALDRFDPLLADQLLESPQNILEELDKAAAEIAGEKTVVRVKNLPERKNIRIRNLRAMHMNKLLIVDAVIKAASEVKPQIYEAMFECPECSAKITVPQETNLVQKPMQCECGRRGDFKLVDKKMFDVRWLTGVEPFEITTGEQPGEIAIFLKEDLTTPKMQKKTDPGSRLKVVGVLKELPKRIKGKLSTKMDMYIEANHIESLEAEFDEMELSPEEEAVIKQMAADPNIYDKLKASIAPSIYGFDEIKECIALQMFGGTAHSLPDGSRIRGNIHILLTGDPGVGKSLVGHSKILHNSNEGPEFTDIGKLVDNALNKCSISRINDSDVCFENNSGVKIASINPETHELEWKRVSAFIRHESPKTLLKVRTKSGREVIATKDHSFVTMNTDGDIVPVTGEELCGKFLPVPIGAHRVLFTDVETGHQIKKTNSSVLPQKIKLDWDFGLFIGMFLAKGSTPGDARVAISSMDKERREPIRRFAESIGLKATENASEIAINSRRLVEFINKQCYASEKTGYGKGSGAIRKSIPGICYFAPPEFVQGLLSGVFSGDGYFINAKPWKGRTKGNLDVELTTISPDLAYGLIEMLSLIGVFSILRKKPYVYKGKKRTKYEITVMGNNAMKLLEKIKMIGKPAPVIGRFSEKDAFDSLPCTNLLYSIVRELGYYKRHKDAEKRRAFAATMRTVCYRGKIGRRMLERIAATLLTEAEFQKNEKARTNALKLMKILGSRTVWDHVVSVEEIPSAEKYVYDLSVDGNETFAANNLVVHNSVMLKLVSSVVPRARYVSGSGVSGAGLTATVIKNEAIGSWVLEAGALILCNKSLLAIDEFDKMSKDDQIAMHEATSVETVSIAKANIVATLPAQTAILAAANPKLGRFDAYRPVIEQIEIPETLMSRFDLKFALKDKPDRAFDESVADRIILSRTNRDAVKPTVDMDLLKRYIAYAKRITNLELLPEAAGILKSFYVDMRNKYSGQEIQTVSITLRQYEALLRLAEASAKVRLDTAIRMQDAERAIRLMKYSLMQLGYDTETGRIDIDKIESGITASKRRKISVILEILDEMQKESREIAVEDLKAEAESRGVEDIDDIIERLKREGTIFEPKPGFVRKV